MTKILVIDDEKDIVELISYNLEREGFFVLKGYDGEAALKLIRSHNPDLLILDLMLPRMSGIDVCKAVRNNPDTANLPIIMATAKADEADKIVGLEIGADDYITKPFSVKELVARVRAVLRRRKDDEKLHLKGKFSYRGLKIDYASYEITVEGKKATLSPTEIKLLFFFTQHPGRVYSRDQILDHVWGHDTFVTPRAVDVHIKRLRSQIEKDINDPQYIITVRGIGYKFSETQISET
ncbi:MAG: DNA-binding response regulator [Deltaproteobacteria bacterium HGW-Deltaproteobacteria-12]|jgi:phosphate regulon transcriptional regulator PhoB|nr:MAG: DNA-binding response regulator [Deltaproteobacteria bacterium HGW-Deltaproteobacteria-12]